MADYVTKDSGERDNYETGARRDRRSGKGRFDLVPVLALRRLAGVYERGAEKYGDDNWQKGMPQSRYMDSALRHLADYQEGLRDEDHLGQAAWNILAMMHQEEAVKRGLLSDELLDTPDYTTRRFDPSDTDMVMELCDPNANESLLSSAKRAHDAMLEEHVFSKIREREAQEALDHIRGIGGPWGRWGGRGQGFCK